MYYLLILAVGIERLIELVVAKRNARWAFSQGGKEFGHDHYPVMVTLHTALLLGCILEVWGLHRPSSVGWVGRCSPWWQPAKRCAGGVWPRWADTGTPWSSCCRPAPLVRRGPYRWLHHPNYVAVVAEGLALPLVHTAWLTAIGFTVAQPRCCSRCGSKSRTRHWAIRMTPPNDYYDADLLIVGGGPAGLASAINARQQGLSVIVAEPRNYPIDKACGEGLMPGGLAELVSLGVDPAGMPLRGIAYLDEQRRVEAPFRGSAGRGVRRTTLHAALASRAKEQDTEWISTRITNVDHDAHGVTAGVGGPREMVDCRRRTAFGGPPRRRYQRGGRTSTTVRGSLALPSAGVVRVRRSPLVAVGRSVCDTRRARPCRRGDPVARAPGPCLVPRAGTPSARRRPRASHAAADPCDRWCLAASRDGCCWWATRPATKTR